MAPVTTPLIQTTHPDWDNIPPHGTFPPDVGLQQLHGSSAACLLGATDACSTEALGLPGGSLSLSGP
jgi:hypothetical protein